MPRRKNILVNNEIYHIVNRGIFSSPIFNFPKEYSRFIELMNYYFNNPKISFSAVNRLPPKIKKEVLLNNRANNKKTIEIYSCCLISNHYHILLKQLEDGGISKFISNIQNAYVKYFNLKHGRKGPMFESVFKSVRIENDSQLLHVSRYIHLNPSSSFLVEPQALKSYPWSSFISYLSTQPDNNERSFINTEKIISLSNSREKYIKFVNDYADYQRKLDQIKHLTFE